MISRDDFFMGRDVKYRTELTYDIEANAAMTIQRANLLLTKFYAAFPHIERRTVNSGWRPQAVNQATPGAALRSKHMTGEAVDLSDMDGLLDEWLLDNPEVLEDCQLWQEHPSATKNWCHVQIVPPKSGKRVFYP